MNRLHVLALVAGAATVTTACSSSVAVTLEPSSEADQVQIASMPIDADKYRLTTQESQAFMHRHDQALEKCMHDRGHTSFIAGPSAPPTSGDGRPALYGVVSMKDATDRGLLVTSWNPYDIGEEQLPPLEGQAAIDFAERYTQPPEAKPAEGITCINKAHPSTTQGAWNIGELSPEALSYRVARLDSVRPTIKAWQKCLKQKGITERADHPVDFIYSRSLADRSSDEAKKIAVADVECKQQTGLVKVLRDGYQEQVPLTLANYPADQIEHDKATTARNRKTLTDDDHIN